MNSVVQAKYLTMLYLQHSSSFSTFLSYLKLHLHPTKLCLWILITLYTGVYNKFPPPFFFPTFLFPCQTIISSYDCINYIHILSIAYLELLNSFLMPSVSVELLLNIESISVFVHLSNYLCINLDEHNILDYCYCKLVTRC